MINTACIIDDDPIYIFAATKILTTNEFCNNIIVYKNGKDAVENLIPMIRSGVELPEIVLLDLNMPIMDGWQVLDELIKEPIHHQMNIYITSSSVDSADLEKAKSYNMVNNYITKPFTFEKINELFNRLKRD